MALPYVVTGITDKVASLMNDTAQTKYTFAAILPYLNMALDDLQGEFQLNNVPVTEDTSAVIPVDAGETVIVFNAGVGLPELPDDLIEIQQVWERQRDTDPWVPMTRKDFLPHYLEGTPISQFLIWTWIDQEIRLPESDADNDIKIDYIKDIFANITINTQEISVLNSKAYLYYKTAALCSRFIGENPTRADSLDELAKDELDIALGISAKGAQNIKTRRKPFRTAYRNRRIIA